MKSESKQVMKPKLRFPEFRNAPAWEETELGTQSSILKGKGISKADIDPKGELPCIRYGELYTRYGEVIRTVFSRTKVPAVELFMSRHNDVIIPGSGETKIDIAKASCVLSDNIALGGDINVIRSDVDGCFLSYYLNGPKKHDIAKVAQGDAVVHLYPYQLERVRIAIPSPAEQQTIGECLASLDELIAAHRQKLDALKIHEKGLIRQLFPVEGETLPRLRFPEFSDAPEWSEYTMIEVAKFRRGSFPQPYGLPEWYDEQNGTPFIQVFDVDDNFRLKETTKSKISNLAAEQSVFIPEGTLIITLQGSIGRVAITQYDAYIDRTLLLFESFLKPIDKFFFAYVIHNLFELEKEKAPGGIIKTITKEALSDFKIKLPCILEQQRIAACLSPIDELISVQAQKLDALKTHKIALMQQLFPSPEEVEA